MKKALKTFEQAVVHVLIALMVLVILVAIVDLGWMVIEDILRPPFLVLEADGLLKIFGFFLLILIGVELLETIKAYLEEHVVHVEVVLEVALIAVARKVIVLDLKEHDAVTIAGIAALIITLAAAFYLEKKARREFGENMARRSPPPEGRPPPAE